MTYEMLTAMVADASQYLHYLMHKPNWESEDIMDNLMDHLIYTYFWDYDNDKPTCNWDKMEWVIRNTVLKWFAWALKEAPTSVFNKFISDFCVNCQLTFCSCCGIINT